jgi:SAM-dependent methyltransferase
MLEPLLSLLTCPECGARLELASGEPDAVGEIESGELRCRGQGHRFPILRGVPRFVPADLSVLERRTAEAFGSQWTHFTEMHDAFEAQFLDWISPVEPSAFEARLVLDAGCGIGRHAYFAAKYGAREVIALDLSPAVDTAREVLRGLSNVHVVQGDLLRPPFPRATFDLAYSIGVIHHLPDPAAGFRSLAAAVAPGGTVLVWVYGYEGNGFVRTVVERMRRVTARVPPGALRAVAFPLAAGFDLTAKGVYLPLRGTRAARSLPMREYLTSVAGFSFRQNYTIVYDQLAAPTAAYVKRGELEDWFEANELEDVAISQRTGNSWRGRGRVPTDASTK